MKEQFLSRRHVEKKSKKRLYTLLMVIACHVWFLGFATTLGYSSPTPVRPAITGNSIGLTCGETTSEELRARRIAERAARLSHVRHMEREKKEIVLSSEQKKKLALILLFAGGQARNSHM